MTAAPVDLRDPAVPELLRHGRIEITGRLVDASNATLFGMVTVDGVELRCVYKPVARRAAAVGLPGRHAGRARGGQPPRLGGGGVARRPADAAARRARSGPGWCRSGWTSDDERELVDVLPPTEVPTGWLGVLRARDGRGEPAVLVHADVPELQAMAVFDVVVNNADRKGGHVLAGVDGRIYGVDHGLCLHVEHKLRTVLWGWVGQPMTPEVLEPAAQAACRLDGGGSFRDELGAARHPPRGPRSAVRGSRRCWPRPASPSPRATAPRSPGPPSSSEPCVVVRSPPRARTRISRTETHKSCA